MPNYLPISAKIDMSFDVKASLAVIPPFKDISTIQELKDYLSDDKSRLKNSEYVYHYTTLKTAISIFRTKTWHLAAASDMNDLLEYTECGSGNWLSCYFSCFMSEDTESIGMWSMYSQPWHVGVKIGIPSKELRRWIRECNTVYAINDSYQTCGRYSKNEFSLSLVSVVYTDFDALGKKKKLRWSNQTNEKVSFDSLEPLRGYVKDTAWSYEKEIRFMAELNGKDNPYRLAVDIPDYVLNSMVITPSPLFSDESQKKLNSEIKNVIFSESIFKKRLQLRTICDNCEYINKE